jgi:acetyl-CoA carboxylase carboxyl transferase subunit beta
VTADHVLGALTDGAVEVDVPFVGRNPISWPGHEPRRAVRLLRLEIGAVAAVWDFAVFGGSFGEDDATALVAAADLAREQRVPLITVVRSGGTRLQEGMAALVGIPRARLALRALSEAGVAHLSVCDHPTTGGVWISVASGADLRVGVSGATIGFAGPRVVEAVTGVMPDGSHTAETAREHGLVDTVLEPLDVEQWLRRALRALTPEPVPAPLPATVPVPTASGWEQVGVSRLRVLGGADLLALVLTDRVDLGGADDTVSASVGRFGGRPVVGVAVAGHVGVRPTPDGYRLAARAFRLADRLGLPVLSLVDNTGAEPGSAAENDGIATAMGEALDALLACRSATVSVVHGEGGSGGALATSATDVVLMTPEGWFAAIGPAGAAAALRRTVEECAELLRLTPADLLALGAVDAVVATAGDALWHLAHLQDLPAAERLEARFQRWSQPLPGHL